MILKRDWGKKQCLRKKKICIFDSFIFFYKNARARGNNNNTFYVNNRFVEYPENDNDAINAYSS